MIRLRHLHKHYQMGDTTVRALDGVSLEIEAGEFVAIMGPSGSGKSTMMHILGLLDGPSSGSFELQGKEVSQLEEEDLAHLRNQSIGFVFQQYHLLARTKASENVDLPKIYASAESQFRTADEVLSAVGLADRQSHKPNELSGGQQQRVSIARALINHPKIILADEPTGNLDSKTEKEIMTLLTELHRQGITVILVTHEPTLEKYVQRVIRLADGKVVEDRRTEPSKPQNSPEEELVAEDPSPKTSSPQHRDPSPDSSNSNKWMNTFLKISAYSRQSWRALMANKARSVLSILGVLIGVASVIAVLALGEGATRSLEDSISSLGSNVITLRAGSRRSGGVSMEAGAVSRITPLDIRLLERNFDYIQAAAPTVSGRAQIVFGNNNWNTSLTGSTAIYGRVRNYKVKLGRFFSVEEDTGRAKVALLGATVARELFSQENPIGAYIKLNRQRFQVIGVLEPKGSSAFRDQDDIVIIPLNTAMRRVLGKDYINSADLLIQSQNDIDLAHREVIAWMNERHNIPEDRREGSFSIFNMAEIRDTISSMTRIMSLLLASIASISLLVGGIGIMNIMLVSVTERTREIGLRKALGATPADVLGQFLIESVVISLFGGTLGILTGWIIAQIGSLVADWSLVVSGGSILMAVAFSASIGVVFGLWPAKRASKLHPIEALRYE